MAAALEEISQAPTVNNTKHMASRAHSCPRCGTPVPSEDAEADARRKIWELEAQVEMLKEKATAAGTYTCHVSLRFGGACGLYGILIQQQWTNAPTTKTNSAT